MASSVSYAARSLTSISELRLVRGTIADLDPLDVVPWPACEPGADLDDPVGAIGPDCFQPRGDRVIHLALEALVVLLADPGLELRQHVPDDRHQRPPMRCSIGIQSRS